MSDLRSICIASTFTAEPVAEVLQFWSEELGVPVAVEFAPYGQVFQSLLDSTSLLSRNRRGLNVLLVRIEDWSAGHTTGAQAELRDAINKNAHDFGVALRTAAETASVPYLVMICPASPSFLSIEGGAEIQQSTSALLIASAGAGIKVADESELLSRYPAENNYDPDGEQLAHIPYTTEFFAGLGTFIFRHYEALRRQPRKAIVLDCDETLWGGVCGEAGPGGVTVDASRAWLHEFLISQYDSGMLLAICSKNTEDDVLAVFRRRPEMSLKLEHFVSWQINWQPKSQNLRQLAQDLNLGLDSFIFIDDNPRECAEVVANLPGVAVLQLPRDSDEIPDFIAHAWVLDRLSLTDEDRKRNDFYKQEADRSRLKQQAPSLEEFLASLDLRIQINPASSANLKRLAQLTTRTNQFNFTTIRRTEAEIQSLLANGWECVAVEVQDRFGDYGIVGNIIFRAAERDIEVDTFLLSCRVLGRTVEQKLLAFLGEKALAYKKESVAIRFVPTAKNRPAHMFLESIGMPSLREIGTEVIFRLPAGCNPVSVQTNLPAGNDHEGFSVDTSVEPVPYVAINRIARELRSVEQIAAGIRRKRVIGNENDSVGFAAGSPVEIRIAEIWKEVLGKADAPLDADFFDLGGDSLQATQVVSRVRQAFGANLMLDSLFEVRTVAGLALAVLQNLTEQVG